MMPTPGRILCINRCFREMPILTQKKPVSLAGRENAQKKARSAVCPGKGELLATAMGEKSQGKRMRGKRDGFFGKSLNDTA